MNRKIFIIVGIVIIAVLGVLIFFSTGGRDIFLNRQQARRMTATSAEIINSANQEEAKGNLIAAISLYKRLVNDFPNSSRVGSWQKKIWDLNINLLFSPILTGASVEYEVKSGDNLAKIAKKYNTTIDFLKRSNNLSSDKIMPGKKIKVWTRPFNIVVDKSQNILILKSDDEIIKTYVVSTGMGNSTPTGKFKIVNKLVDPPWFKDGTMIPSSSPENILGSRWMGFDRLPSYGIHGTTQNETLGQQITQGCVRMSNFDVEELYTIVPAGTEVVIVD